MDRRAVNEITYLLRKERPSRPVFLLGAGASYRAGIPLADETVRRIARAAFYRQVAGGHFNLSWIKPSDVTRFLENFPWYVREVDRWAENFPRAVEYLLVPREFRREFFLEMIGAPNGLNEGYRHLADIMMRGLCHTVLTTNFDSLIVDALREKTPHIRHIVEVNRVSGDLEQFNIFGRNQVVYLHGAVEFYTDRNIQEETAHLDTDLVIRLRPLLNDSPLIVIGYRGAEPSVMKDLLEAGISASGQFRHGIYWCTLPGTPLHPNVIHFSELLGANFFHLEIDSFDTLMTEIAAETKGEDCYEAENRRPIATPGVRTFDEKPLEDASLEDLDQGLILATLTTYCDTLHRAPVTHENYIGLLLEQGLLMEIDGTLRPTMGCYLLFGREVTKRFPHASVTVTRNGKQRRVFDGNLLSQFHGLVEYLDLAELNPELRVKGAMAAIEQKAYPKRVITEAVVNLLVHRDYSTEDFAAIEADSGVGLVFRNPGGLSERLRRQLKVDADGNFLPIRNTTEIRNPSLADIFFGLGSMDKAGSGLADVQDLMVENGGNASFAIEREDDAFRTSLFQPLQRAPGDSAVARPVAPVGLYITNLLPFAVIPESVWIFTTRRTRLKGERLFMLDENPGELPLFVEEGSRLISFADFHNYPDLVRRRGSVENVSLTSLKTFVEDPNDHRLFIWLLRKHWEFHLKTYREKGLQQEPKKQRAYFRLLEGERNTVVYDSPKRRGVRRDVVKRRGSDRYIWHENEGIAFSVVEYDGTWAIQIKPFYMFTTKDGLTPLPSFERTARATRRMRFDRNRNVDDDLTFWARFLSHGNPTIQLSCVGVEDLVLSANYQTAEVPERGGMTQRANQD
jgi:hypothetical protein